MNAATDPTGTADIFISIMGIVDGIYGYSDEDNYELDDEEYAYVLQDYENFAATMEQRAPRNLIGPTAGPDEHGNIIENYGGHQPACKELTSRVRDPQTGV